MLRNNTWLCLVWTNSPFLSPLPFHFFLHFSSLALSALSFFFQRYIFLIFFFFLRKILQHFSLNTVVVFLFVFVWLSFRSWAMVVGSWYVQLADTWRWFLPLCTYMTVKVDVFTVIVYPSCSFLFDVMLWCR